MLRAPYIDIHGGYRRRILLCAVAVLLGSIALVRFWPAPGKADIAEALYDTRGQEIIEFEMIQPTKQVRQKPPPPRPLPPIEVPDYVELEEVVLDIDSQIEIGTGEDVLEGDDAVNTGPSFIARADEAPKPVKFVEPEYSREARKERIRAQIVVEVRVDEKGHVQESRIIDRYLINNQRQKQPVVELGYGLEEAILAAADRWQFVPARHNGRVVQSLATLEFTIGR